MYLYEMQLLIYLICFYLRIVVSNTSCVVFMFFFILCTLSWQFLWIALFCIAPSVFSNVCLTIYDRITNWHTQKNIILQKDIVQKTILPLNFFSLLIKMKYIKLRKKSSLIGIMKSLKKNVSRSSFKNLCIIYRSYELTYLNIRIRWRGLFK